MNKEKLEHKIDEINEKLSSIDVTLTKQASQLEHHIYRTDLAEENINVLREELKPVQKHVQQVSGVLKFFGLLAVFAGIIKAIVEVYKLF